MMDRISEIVCAIIRESLFEESFDRHFKLAGELDDETIAKVHSELSLQTVLCFADKWILEHKPHDDALFEKWSQSSRTHQLRVVYILSAQQELVKLFNKNDIGFVIIKGSAASIYYPDPYVRMMGDVDLLVKRADFERASKLLEENGYTQESVGSDQEKHHSGYTKHGIMFELHRRLPIVDEGNELLLKAFEKGVDERVNGKIDYFEFPMFKAGLNGLVLLFHINQHLRVGLGLRQILDWMMFVDKYIDDAAWEGEYRELTASLGMDKFAKIVTQMCVRHLGLRKDITWCSDADADICDDFLNYIIDKGNFGIKAGKEGHVASVFLRTTNPFKMVARLQQKGLDSWDKAKKHAILRPFAWMYEASAEMKRIRGKQISVAKMNELKNKGLEQRRFIESLGLDADRNIYDDN